MAILRSVGARPVTILSLLVAEAGVLTLCGVALGTLLLYGALIALQPFIDRTYGLHIPIDPPTRDQLLVLGAIVEARLCRRPASRDQGLPAFTRRWHDCSHLNNGTIKMISAFRAGLFRCVDSVASSLA